MPFELQAVVWSTLILFALLLIQGAQVPLNQGFGWGLGSRDEPRDPSAFQGRAARTVANHIEGMMLFVPLALVAAISELSTPLSVWGAGLYLAGRAGYAPIYLMGVPVVRSLLWAVSVTGIILVAIAVITAML